MVKIYESKQPERVGMTYLKAVEDSIRKLEQFHRDKARAVHESELACECREGFGETWTYNPNLDACVDERLYAVNRHLKREGSEITVNTNSLTDPEFRGQWGTPVQSDSQIDTRSDNAKTVYGTDPTRDFPYRRTYESNEPKKVIKLRV